MLRRAFGLRIDLGFPLPGLHQVDEERHGPKVKIELGSGAEIDAVWGPDPGIQVWTTVFPEGDLVTVAQREDGAQRLAFGAHATFVLAPDRGHVTCAPSVRDDPRWQRFLLDTVLWWTAAIRGFYLLHCCTLRGPGGVVAFASLTGGGKTTLALELLRRGWTLVCDDVLAVEETSEGIVAHAAPGLMNAPALTCNLDAVGVPVATIGDEVWLEVKQADGTPCSLTALVLYARGDEFDLTFEPRNATLLDLVPHVWDVLGGVDRVRDRFNFLGRIADSIPVFTLTAQTRTAPERIADTIENALLNEAAPTQ